MPIAKLANEANLVIRELLQFVTVHARNLRGINSLRAEYADNGLSPLLAFARIKAVWDELNSSWQYLLGTTGNPFNDYDITVEIESSEHAMTLVDGGSSKELQIVVGSNASVQAACTAYFAAGDIVTLSNMANAADDGNYTVSSQSGTTTRTIVFSETGAWGTAGACPSDGKVRHYSRA